MLGTWDHRWQPRASEVAREGGGQVDGRLDFDFGPEEFALPSAGKSLVYSCICSFSVCSEPSPGLGTGAIEVSESLSTPWPSVIDGRKEDSPKPQEKCSLRSQVVSTGQGWGGARAGL